MTTRSDVDAFLSGKRLAVAGVSRGGKKFGNTVYRELQAKDYQVVAINRHADQIDGETCYPSLAALPEPVDGVVIVLPPQETEKVVREAAGADIGKVWMQQGAESEAAIQFCHDHGIRVVHGECILMFAEPTGFGHRLHRWVWGVLGKLPD